MSTTRLPVERPTTMHEAGRACPYCRFPLKEGAQVVVCGHCSALHHDECWRDNGGCSVMGCAGAADPSALPTAQLGAGYASPATGATQFADGRVTVGAPSAFPTPPPVASGGAPVPPDVGAPLASPSSAGRRNTALVAAVVLLAFAVIGATTVLALSRGEGTAGPQGTDAQIDNDTAAPEPVPEPEPEPVDSNGVLPDTDETTMADDITDVLVDHHQAIVDRDFRTAWELLSHRKQVQNEARYGYAEWSTGQASLSDYLGPLGLEATIIDLDEDTGVATVDVGGMSWSKPGSSCAEWGGTTWMKYENGEWRYDPGYSTTPQREREWKSRYDELMGVGC